LQFCEIVLH